MNKIKLGLLIIFWSALFVQACSTTPERTVDRIDINKVYNTVEILHPPLPKPISWNTFEWKVLTPEIMQNLLDDLKAGDLTERDLVFYAITTDGYEDLTKNMARVIRFIKDQNTVIMYYKTTVPKEIIIEAE